MGDTDRSVLEYVTRNRSSLSAALLRPFSAVGVVMFSGGAE